jgi:hypothetical protein
MRKKRIELMKERQKACAKIFSQIADIFQGVVQGKEKYVFNSETKMYIREDIYQQYFPTTPYSLVLCAGQPNKGERVALSTHEIDTSLMSSQMAAYMLSDLYSNFGPWLMEYKPNENNTVGVYMTYNADYRFMGAGMGKYTLVNCVNGETLAYDIHGVYLEPEIQSLKAQNPNVVIDFVNSQNWLATVNSENQLEPFTRSLYCQYANVYVGWIDRGNVHYELAMQAQLTPTGEQVYANSNFIKADMQNILNFERSCYLEQIAVH